MGKQIERSTMKKINQNNKKAGNRFKEMREFLICYNTIKKHFSKALLIVSACVILGLGWLISNKEKQVKKLETDIVFHIQKSDDILLKQNTVLKGIATMLEDQLYEESKKYVATLQPKQQIFLKQISDKKKEVNEKIQGIEKKRDDLIDQIGATKYSNCEYKDLNKVLTSLEYRLEDLRKTQENLDGIFELLNNLNFENNRHKNIFIHLIVETNRCDLLKEYRLLKGLVSDGIEEDLVRDTTIFLNDILKELRKTHADNIKAYIAVKSLMDIKKHKQ